MIHMGRRIPTDIRRNPAYELPIDAGKSWPITMIDLGFWVGIALCTDPGHAEVEVTGRTYCSPKSVCIALCWVAQLQWNHS